MSPTKPTDPLSRLIHEAREDVAQSPELDWSRVEEALFARVAKEQREIQALRLFRGSRMTWGVTAGVAVAVAAAVALVAGRAGPEHPREATMPAASVDGHEARVGSEAAIETHGAPTLFEAGARATWLLEGDSRVRVTTETPLVLSLERGGVEAQVAPVPNGEAFAVDVEGVRVAVHGTHLRVARDGDQVTVDLSEGVVSIGAPPRVGSTYGTLVVAPAHVEFACGDLLGSLRVTHDRDALRPALDLASLAVSPPAVPAQPPRLVTSGSSAPPPARSNVAALSASRGSAPHPAAVAPVDPHADETVAAAVRACSADAPHSSDVKVTVSSTLELMVGDDGLVRSARFDPPLAPEIQSCASSVIYKTRFAAPGARSVALVLQR